MTTRRVINVSNRLPVTIGPPMRRSAGGLVSALEGIVGEYDLCWVGWPGEAVEESRQAEVSEKLLSEYGYLPVFLDQAEVRDHYDGFSNSSLWPLLHYMSTRLNYDDRWFETYQSVNRRFAETILARAQPGDLVWIHDYHLMLLPQMLRAMRPDLKTGFFLHTPFPSYEVFRCHPRREALMEGLLGADLIGFHTFGYMRHFRSTVLRLLGLESHIDSIDFEGRQTRIGVYPIGINWRGFEAMLATGDCQARIREFREQYSGRRLVLSVERLDYTKGIPEKLRAIERFLQDYPDRRENTVFVIISVPSREGVGEYQDLKDEVELAVGRINGRYSTISNIPIHFIHRGVRFDQLCALYAVADVSLVTPMIDGMNLVAKEYVACQNPDQDCGVLVLSEFAGAAQELFRAIAVNPYDVERVAGAIHQALSLGGDEKRAMMRPMRDRVIANDSVYWANRFISELDRIPPVSVNETGLLAADAELIRRFRSTAGRKALFLDYDGTLREFETNPRAAVPSEELLQLLGRLVNRPDIDVHVVSGRNAEFLEQHLGHFNLTLIAEHGYKIRAAGGAWRLFNDKVDVSWKQKVREVFDLYTLTTPGSSVEMKTSAIVWHYRKSDPEFGKWKAAELVGELTEVISNLPVEIHHGKMIVEVSSLLVNKGLAVEHCLKANPYTFSLCAGDDQTDEAMFRLRGPSVATIKVGEGDTAAEYHVPGPHHVRELLSQL